MIEVTTIRTLPPGPEGEPSVEVSAHRVGVLGRLIGGLVGLVVVAALVVLAIIAIPLLLIGLAIVLGLGLIWLAWFLLKIRMAARRLSRQDTPIDDGRENVRVRPPDAGT